LHSTRASSKPSPAFLLIPTLTQNPIFTGPLVVFENLVIA